MKIIFRELLAPTVTGSSVQLWTAMACELDLDLCHFNIEQAFMLSDLNEKRLHAYASGLR